MSYHEPVLGWYPTKQKYALRCSVCGKVLKEFSLDEFDGCGPEPEVLGVTITEDVILRDVFGQIGDGGVINDDNSGTE